MKQEIIKDITLRGGTYHIRAELYNSTPEMLRDIMSRRLIPEMSDRGFLQGRDPGSPSWSGFKSSEQLQEFLRDGMTADDQIRDLKKFITNANQGIGMDTFRKNSVVGSSVSVPRYVSGIPTCMRTRGKRPAQKRTIHVVIDIGAHCDISANEMRKQARYLAAVADKIQRMGYSMRLDVVGCSKMHGGRLIITGATVKTYATRISLPRLLFWCGSPAAFRGAIFNHWAVRADIPKDDCCGLGYSLATEFGDADLQKIYRAVYGKDVIPINMQDYIDRRYSSDEEAMLALQATIMGED